MAARFTRCADSRNHRSIRNRPGGAVRRAEYERGATRTAISRINFFGQCFCKCKGQKMAPDFLNQANWRRDDAKAIDMDGLSGNLSEAERALQELADVFLQQQSLISRTNLDLSESAESKLVPEAPLLS